MGFTTGYLAAHPLPSGITGALSIGGYQLLADVGGIGAGRLGSQAFLLVAPDEDSGDAMTHIVLHQGRLKDEMEATAYVQLAAQLGYLRLAGYRVSLERAGMRSKLALVNPATGAMAAAVPEKPGGKLFGGGINASSVLAGLRALPAAGRPPDLTNPDGLSDTLLALALGDDSIGGAEAAELADRALRLITADPSLDPARALAVAKGLPAG